MCAQLRAEFVLSKSIEVENVVECYRLADMYGAETLRKHCVNFALENANEVAQLDEVRHDMHQAPGSATKLMADVALLVAERNPGSTL